MKKKGICGLPLADGQTALQYIGQEGFVIGKAGKYLAVDPYLSDYVDQNCCQFVEWKRLYAPPVQAEELDFLEAVLCTHSHYDHTDPWTLTKISKANPNTKFIVPAPEVDRVASYGIDPARILPAYADTPLSIGGFTVTPIPSAHEVFHTDGEGNYRELGYVIDDGLTRIFHAGDMCMYDGLIERLHNVDVAILPINGRDYFRNANDIIGNMDSVEAVTLAKSIGADLLIPVHHDLYEVNMVSPAHFVDAVMKLHREQRYHIFVPGECYIYAKA